MSSSTQQQRLTASLSCFEQFMFIPSKTKALVTPHICNIGGRVFSSMTSSLLNKLPAIVRGTDTVSVFIV